MNIVMHCGGLPFNGNTIKERSLGGSESAAYYMARELAAIGHKVKLFTNHKDGGLFEGVEYIWAGNVSQQFPLGDMFEFYAVNTPHDVLIIQRHPHAFRKLYASKVNFLWLHDLALYRNKDEFCQQLWNIDAVLCVSEYHKRQVCDVYGLKPDIVHPVKNGIDPSLFEELPQSGDNFTRSVHIDLKAENKYLLYSSRPERGLEHLVRPGGIMEQLLKMAPECHLLVCGYDNTTEDMLQYYQYLWTRCNELPNVTNIGALTKIELAQLMKRCFLHVYPTEFEEVSCITAMEAAAAGLPFLSSAHAALPETCQGSGSILLPLKENSVDEEAFTDKISWLCGKDGLAKHKSKVIEQNRKCSDYTWEAAAEVFDNAITRVFFRPQNSSTIKKHLMEHSDIVTLSDRFSDHSTIDAIEESLEFEFLECYKFFIDGTYAKHYADYYEYEKNRGVDYGPENLFGNLRFEHVSDNVGSIPSGSVVLDYGCAHGHYTINLAKRFPNLQFIGVDIAKSNIEKAKMWAESDEIKNVSFYCGEVNGDGDIVADVLKDFPQGIDAVLCCEVLEHTGEATKFLDGLMKFGMCGTKFIITVPYGPWEAQGYQEHWPWRAHLYEFERQDLDEMFGHLKDYTVSIAPSGKSDAGEPLGSFIVTFKADGKAPKKYRKVAQTIPRRQTLSLCMIAHNAQNDIERCLLSALPIVDEVLIGIDENTDDETLTRALGILCKKHGLAYNFITVKSPLDVGFDAARNAVIEQACGDWILWLDSDEELNDAKSILPYLRNNQYDGYALQQHHVSANPPGIIKTDNPCKLFRNKIGIKFYGVVHEHPEVCLGDGVPYTLGLGGACIMHYGYPDEPTRRARFKRNIDLLVRDREKYPSRTLGKMLWLRDLAQMSQYEAEQTGSVSKQMMERAEEGVLIWRELMEENIRMAIDALPFYSSCVRLLGKGFEMSLSLDTNLTIGNANSKHVQPVEARFFNEEHARLFQNTILHERVKNYESRYF